MPQRSPVIFWLLLAATVSIDVVVFSWAARELGYFYHAVTYDGLMLSQLSVVCIWSVLSASTKFWTKIAPLLAAVAASLAVGLFAASPLTEISDGMIGSVAHYGIHTALVWALLWLFARTPLWTRRRGASARWQFSLANLFVAATIIAILAAATHQSNIFGRNYWENSASILSSVALAVVSVIIWCFSPHWLLRSAAIYALAILLGFAWWKPSMPEVAFLYLTYYLIQASVIIAWLGIGGILAVSSERADT
jgi:hypothetical protein